MSAKKYAIPTPVQFDRLYAGPLDKYEVFESYSEALVYAQGPISYPGQTIGVKRTGLKEDVYVINQDKSMSRLMIQREDIRLVLKKENWIGEVPYEQTLAVPYLEATDNCIISLSETVTDPQVVREIVNAKIGDTIQEEGSIRFIARGDKPKVDIPITITIGSVVSAVEIPNNVNDNTNHTVVIAKKDAWVGTKPPYTQELHVFGVRPDSNGTIGINPDSSFYTINSLAASTAGVRRFSQSNNTVTIAAMNSKPTRDLEILVVWGDEIVVWENTDAFEDFNTSLDLVLKANEWSVDRPYTQTIRVEGLSEYHTGAIGLSTTCTPEQAETAINAGLELIEQGTGYVVVEAKDIKPEIDIPIYLTYGSNITVISSPEYVGEANRHVDTIAYSSKWTECPDGWEQIVDVEGITSNSIGTMGLKNGASELQAYNAAVARIKITKVYDNKVILTATKIRPNINIPLCFVFGRNINVTKYPGVIGKVTVDTNYIAFDDSTINSGYSTVQQLLEYFNKTKVGFTDVVDNLYDNRKTYPLSANMGKKLNEIKVNYEDIVDTLYPEDHIKNPENITSELHQYLPDTYTVMPIGGATATTINFSPTITNQVVDIVSNANDDGIIVKSLGNNGILTSFDLRINTSRPISQPNKIYLLQIKTNKVFNKFRIFDINPDDITIETRSLTRSIQPFEYSEYVYGGLISNESMYQFNKDNTWVFKNGNDMIEYMNIRIMYGDLEPHNPEDMVEVRIFELVPEENIWNDEHVLSARMGKFLSNSKIDKTDIVDNLADPINIYSLSNTITPTNITTNDSRFVGKISSDNIITIKGSNIPVMSGFSSLKLDILDLKLSNDSTYLLHIKPNTNLNITYQIPFYEAISTQGVSYDRYILGSCDKEAEYGFNNQNTFEIRTDHIVTELNINMKLQVNTQITSETSIAEITIFKLESSTKVLSANIGRYLDAAKIGYTDTVDKLTSNDIFKPLSANMGKNLKTSINSIETEINEIGKTIISVRNELNKNINNAETEISEINERLSNSDIDNNIVFKIQSSQPKPISGKNVVWIKI